VLTESVEAIQSAIAAFQEAESLGHKTAASNRGNALLRLGRLPEALAAHESAVARDPHHPGARYNLALTQLRLGDFAQGWPNYEIRWSFRDLHPHPRRFPAPRWDGHPPAERTSPRLFLYAEQGLGDTLQFVRYLPQIAAMGFKITLEIQPPLSRLLQPFVSNLGGELIPHGAAIPPFDLHCPLLSLPAVFSTTIETIPAQIPYLHPASNLQSPRPNPQSIRIGLAWAGNPNYRADYERSTHLKTFLPLLELPNIQFVSLQKGPAAAQIAEIARQFNPQSNRQPNLDDACSRDRDLADTAAVLAGLDLVITTDTVIAHLAGAMGKPLWILLPWQSDWRWMQDRLDTPWYPQARLFRQTTPGGWPGLVSQVRAELAAFASKTPLTRPATGSSATPGQPL
jgi:tetratricopeptide (TPR) repeat protein